MWLVVTIYTDGMDINCKKFKTKTKAIKHLEDLGYKKSRQFGRNVGFIDYGSYAEIMPMDAVKNGET